MDSGIDTKIARGLLKGTVHTMNESGTPARPKTDEELKQIEQGNKDKNICLTCTEKKCNGSDKCFKQHKKNRGKND